MSELHFLKNPYHSECISDKKALRYCSNLARGRFLGDKVAICLSLGNDELDLINFREICGPISKNANYYIVGVSKNSDDALEVVRLIVQDIYDKTGQPKIKKYFEEVSFC